MSIIFVFGSNLAGRHGKGAALTAIRNYGATWGEGIGLNGQSYAIPTRDANLNTLSLSTIKCYVDDFLTFAKTRPDLNFLVTRVGCGLAGYTNADMAPLFKGAPANCFFSADWHKYL